jgi:hypothetical protein
MDPFPSQRNDDYQPPAELTDENGNEEYRVDHILNEHTVKRGRGSRKEYLVKWTGWRRPTWTNAKFLEDTEALDKWEQRSGSSAGRGGE